MNYLIKLVPLLLLTAPVYASSQCSLSGHSYPVPSSMETFVAALFIEEVFVNYGYINYTCNSQGTYGTGIPWSTYYDTSCYYEQCSQTFTSYDPNQPHNQVQVYNQESAGYKCMGGNPSPYGEFYYHENSYYWNGLWSYTNGSTAPYLQGTLTASYPGSVPQYDVNTKVYTIDAGYSYDYCLELNTYSGQPPSSCTYGQTTSQRYSSMFYCYSSSGSSSSGQWSNSNSNSGSGSNGYSYNGNSNSGSGNNNNANSNSGSGSPIHGALSTDSNSSNDDSSSMQSLVNQSAAMLGLLALTTVISLAILSLGVYFIYKNRGAPNTRSAPMYQPVKLPRPSTKMPLDDPYQDEERYGG